MKKKRKLLLLIAASLLLSGCANQSKAERLLENALEERYGEEFVVKESIVGQAVWDKAGPLYAVCYPISDESLYFEATSNLEGGIYREEYIQAIVREEAYAEMEKILSEQYTDFFLDVRVSPLSGEFKFSEDYIEFENIDDVSILSYEELYGEKMIISFDMIFNVDEIENYEEVSRIFQEYSEKFTDGCINYFCYYMPSNFINECNELEKTDYWENFYASSKKAQWGNNIEYVYRFKENKFYLGEMSDENSISITESEE